MKNPLKSLHDITKDQNSNPLVKIVNQFEYNSIAQNHLNSVKINYLRVMKVCFFDGKKLVLATNIPEMLSKFREMKDHLITSVKVNIFFKNLKEIKVILNIPASNFKFQRNNKLVVSQNIKNRFYNLKKLINNIEITNSINNLKSNHAKKTN